MLSTADAVTALITSFKEQWDIIKGLSDGDTIKADDYEKLNAS